MFEIKWIFLHPSHVLQLSQFVWTLRSSVLVVFNNFLLTDATDTSEISSDQKRFFIALSLYPLSFFANTPFKPGIRYKLNIHVFVSENVLYSVVVSLHKLTFAILTSETMDKLSELNTFQPRKTWFSCRLLIRLKFQGYRC